MYDNRINEIINSEISTKGLELLDAQPSVGSLSETDEFDHEEMKRFWIISRQIQESTITGKEPFPGEMMKPFAENILLSADNIDDLIVNYYNEIYERLEF